MIDLIVEVTDNIELVKLNRPRALNALRRQTLLELDSVIEEFSRNSEAKSLILSAEGERAFCSGGDIKEMEKMSSAEAESFARLAHQIFSRMQAVPKPIVAAVNGAALGAGCDLVTACDISIASEESAFGMPSFSIGVITPFGGTQRLPSIVGPIRAKYMFFTGEIVNARTAVQIGLISKVVKHEALMQEAQAVAAKIMTMAPIALKFGKQLINMATYGNPEEANELEIELYAKCFDTHDRMEGIRAFIEKRRPNFKGK